MPAPPSCGVGSSPHTRGAPQPASRRGDQHRIIPAYAGSTHHPSSRRTTTGDHPRIRGEHGIAKKSSPNINGSSPHTRGAPSSRRRSPGSIGIIPAYAGSTTGIYQSSAIMSDHPRIRGEHRGRGFFDHGRGGSSPHTRGAPVLLGIPASPIGIIPAYAGSTRRS